MRVRVGHVRGWMIMLLCGAVGLGLAQWPLTTRQGINGTVFTTAIPLWVKGAEFLIRDHHQRRLAREISAGATTPQEKVMTIFHWTHRHIRPQPRSWPVIDDHVYAVIVRGYGTADQSADVLTTLCAYAGIPATLMKLEDAAGQRLYLGVVRLNGRWCPLDPYHGVYFQDSAGALLSIEELANAPSRLVVGRRGALEPAIDYAKFIRAGMPFQPPRVIRPYAHMP